MSLLEDIQTAAVDSSTPIADLLRRCTLLAARLQNLELETWAAAELDGYATLSVPDYRALGAYAHGVLDFGVARQTIIIPSLLLPDSWKQRADRVTLTQPIAAIEKMAAEKDGVHFPWPGEL